MRDHPKIPPIGHHFRNNTEARKTRHKAIGYTALDND